MHKIQNYLLVTLFTVLIWVYAEARVVQKYPADGLLTVPITLKTGTADFVVVSQSLDKIGVQFKGASSEIDELRRRLASGLELRLDSSDEGEQEIVLAEALAETPLILAAKVNIARVEPATIKVKLERMEKAKSVEVVFTPTDVRMVDKSVQVTPPRVNLRMLKSQWAVLGDAPLQLEPLVDIKTLPAGQEQTVRARVRLPDSLEDSPLVQLKPQEVQLSFVIEKREVSVTLPAVPVWVMKPPGETDHLRVQFAEESRVLKDVKVSGPVELVAKVRDKSLPVVAYIRLSLDELVKATGAESTATVNFALPPGLVVESPASTVRFTVIKAVDPTARPSDVK